MTSQTSILSVPEHPPTTFERNLIRTATCELRFPILLDLEIKPPAKVAQAVRKEYPHYEKKTNVNVRPGSAPVDTENLYVFRSKDGSWSVSMKAWSIALETTKYTNFADLKARLEKLLAATSTIIDSDFFTRVGLRYINALPVPQHQLSGWVNEDLVHPLSHGVYGKVDVFHQEVLGATKSGHFSFRHGIATRNDGTTEYIIDSDFYKENVEAGAALDLIDNLHSESFDFFLWTLGKEAIKHLGKATPKKVG